MSPTLLDSIDALDCIAAVPCTRGPHPFTFAVGTAVEGSAPVHAEWYTTPRVGLEEPPGRLATGCACEVVVGHI
jgi:hypothetical protein